MTSGFDRLARLYRWVEYLSFGPALKRCRLRFLADVAHVQRALVLGDGDGRFAAELLRRAPRASVVAVDGSAAMLRELRVRCGSRRAITLQADLAGGLPPMLETGGFDLVATHFFLDCLSTPEVDRLVGDVVPRLNADAGWIVSEFDVPQGAAHLPAVAIVRLLYVAFRLLTGLRQQQLPAWRSVLERHGMVCRRRERMLCGLLVAEWWSLPTLAAFIIPDGSTA